MKIKSTVKKIIDAAMLILIPLLAAEISLGQELHEWLGLVMAGLFVLHHVMNYRWFIGIFKGEYNMVRAFVTTLNLLLLMDMLILAYSGIQMSGYVLRGLALPGSKMTARVLHLFSSWWSFLLIALHTGVHSGLHGNPQKNKKDDAALWFARGLLCALCIFGAYAFIDLKIGGYLFLQTHFMFFDETKSLWLYFAEVICMVVLFAVIGYYLTRLLKGFKLKNMGKKIVKILAFAIPIGICAAVILALHSDRGGSANKNPQNAVQPTTQAQQANVQATQEVKEDLQPVTVEVEDGFLLIKGGTFEMGSPESENWRGGDETLHKVTVSDFYMSPYELTQKEYEEIMGRNPSNFRGMDLPVENVTWLEAAAFCNALSESKGLKPVYVISESSVTWDRSADGYRLPTEAEWEYACRAGTVTPFNTQEIPGAENCNFYGHYPYQIEQNYFTQEKLDTKPGEYRQTTVSVDSFAPNGWGLYNMHGNVSEWVWDYYGAYEDGEQTDPTGAQSGNLRVYRGGGWNDFGKNTRSAYRGTMAQDMASFNVGIRLVRNAVSGNSLISSSDTKGEAAKGGKVLIAFFSWSGNTRGIAQKIQAKTGADLFEIQLVKPYSNDYNTVLDQAQHDQNIQARPELANKIENFGDYDTILIGYPNWWASIPMPIASLLEEYDFSGKTIIPFCSHGGGRFGQSITAIAKLAPDAVIGEGLSVHYSGGSSLDADIDEWIVKNNIKAE